MRLLQITAIISAVLVDAAYVYNAPNLSVGVLSNHPVPHAITNNIYQQQAHLTQDNRGEDKTLIYSNTYKGYGYINNGNVPNYLLNNHQFTANQNHLNAFGNLPSGANNAGVGSSLNFQTNGANNVKNGYKDYTQSWSNKNNLNTDIRNILTPPSIQQNYQHNTWKPVNNGQLTANGYQQSLPPINQNAKTGQSNQYSISHSQVNNIRTNLHNNVNYNSGFSNTLTSTAQDGVHNNGLIPPQVKHDAPLNNGFNQMGFNTNYEQSGLSSAPLNNGYTQDIQSNPALDSAFSQSSPIVVTSYNKGDTIYTQGLAPIDSAKNNLAHNNLHLQQTHLSNNFNSLLPVTPIIHKHVYFHVPPPDLEEPQKYVSQPVPLKKDYKILFIKVPSQTTRLNLARLQQQMAQAAALQEKTLIYVLVKKQEQPEPVVLSPPKQSHHQVFFVKYNGDPFDIASQVNDEIEDTGTIKSIVPLAPGLVNGQS